MTAPALASLLLGSALLAACSSAVSPSAPVGASGGAATTSAGATSGGTPSASGGTRPDGGAPNGAGGSGPSASGGAGAGSGAVSGSTSEGGSAGRPSAAGGAVTASGGAPGATGGNASGGTDAGSGAGGEPDGGRAPTPAEDVIVTIKNGGFWTDVDGNRIEAHGGGFWRDGDTWYWVGEDKSHNAGTFRGVNLYSSPDLSRWTFRNAIITRQTAPELDAADRIIERPKLVYNERTQRYVMWLHWEGQNYAEAEAGVFSSTTIDGDYTYHSSFRPNRNMARDDTLFKDDDGTAYFIAAANENADLVIYELTDDYLDIERQVVTLWADSYREAPAMFKVGERYFLVTSGATGWDPNQAKYSSATSIQGPWSALQNLGDGTTYDSQPTFVIPIVGSEATTYVYAGDRWQDPDLGSSKYIWLPLRVSGTTLSLGYYPEWQLNFTRGTWGVDDGYLPQSGWSVERVSSEETADENGAASNAFDDSPTTYWHTEWGGDASPSHPHELVIDLGARYTLDAFRHTPRQDKDPNGMIVDYEFYVGESATDFGEPVASGSLGTTREPTRVEFPAKVGRYVRLVALSEINGDKFTSLGELDVAGAPL